MAIKQTRIDDFDSKSEGASPTFFSLNDVFYVLDLAPANLKKLEELLKPFIDKASQTGPPRGGKRSPASAYANGHTYEVEPQAIRNWAAAQTPPIELAERGRIPEDIAKQYHAAQAAQNNK